MCEQLARYQNFLDEKSESDAEILDHLIDQWIVRNEAKAALFPQPSDEEVQRSLERLKRSFSSPEAFEEREKQAGLTDDDVMRMLRSQMYLSNYLDSRFRASIQVDEKDIEEFYKTRVIPRAESRGQTPPTLEAARGFIQEVLVQRAINVQADRWLKESRARLRVEKIAGREPEMTKESRWRKILWVEHLLWVLGTWTLLLIALAVIAVGSGLANPLLRRILINRVASADGRTGGNPDGFGRMVFVKCDHQRHWWFMARNRLTRNHCSARSRRAWDCGSIRSGEGASG